MAPVLPPRATPSKTPPERLLRDTVPAAIAGALKHGRESDLAAMAAELKVRDLVQAVIDAHRHLPAPTGLRTQEFAVVERSDDRAVATAPMAFCPESVLIVHGPIMVGRACAVAERLWGSDFHLTGVQRIKFRRPVRHDLILHLWRGVPADPLIAARAVVRGTLLGRDGDVIAFAGIEGSPPVSAWIDNREVASLTRVAPVDDAPGRHTITLAGPAETSADDLLPRSLPEAVQLLLEAMVRTAVLTRCSDGRTMLLGGVRYLTWPDDLLDRLRQGVTLVSTAKPLGRALPGAIWHPLAELFDGAPPAENLSARLDFAEAHTTMLSVLQLSVPEHAQ